MENKERYFVYILLCKDGSLYTGYSPHPKHRFEEHVAGKGAKYTRSHPPLKILMIKEYPTKHYALRAEYFIKRRPRKQKIAFLKKNHVDVKSIPINFKN